MSNIGFAVELPFTANGHLSDQTLGAVKTAGFDFVVLHTDQVGKKADIFLALKKAGLKVIALSVPIARFLDGPDGFLVSARSQSIPDIILQIDDTSAIQAGEGVLSQLGSLMTGDAYRGIRFLLAFQNSKGITAKECEARFSSMCYMLDTFALAQHQDKDAAAVVRSLPDRCPLLIVQDVTETDSAVSCAVGEGRLDWEAIFDAAEESSIEWYICRAEDVDAGLEQARKSLEFLTEHA